MGEVHDVKVETPLDRLMFACRGVLTALEGQDEPLVGQLKVAYNEMVASLFDEVGWTSTLCDAADQLGISLGITLSKYDMTDADAAFYCGYEALIGQAMEALRAANEDIENLTNRLDDIEYALRQDVPDAGKLFGPAVDELDDLSNSISERLGDY
ncbi:MAG: hypothetical protein WC822_02505 [Candidatus Paceibacterota bacterium]|jgi:hypothetical protein